MRTSGSRRQAWAWTTWARPISPPSRVTNELSDMFCALNGATRTPSWSKMRHIAAVSTLLPALELVPWSIKAGGLFLSRGMWPRARPWSPLPRERRVRGRGALSLRERVRVRAATAATGRPSP